MNFALRFRNNQHTRYTNHWNAPLTGGSSALGVVNEEKLGVCLHRKCDCVRFTPVKQRAKFRNRIRMCCALLGQPAGS